MVEGSNVWLNRGRMGFFATRWIEAGDEQEATAKAIDLVKKELDALQAICNPADEQPTFSVESLREIESFENLVVPGKGFTFYPEEPH